MHIQLNYIQTRNNTIGVTLHFTLLCEEIQCNTNVKNESPKFICYMAMQMEWKEQNYHYLQECIPVGCVTTTTVAATRCQ